MAKFILRSVKDSDSRALIQLIGSCYAEYPGCILDVDKEEPWLNVPASYYEKIHGTFWVVELNGQVCACIGIKFHESGLAEPKTLYVTRHARRNGLATFLMGLVESYARLNGVQGWSFWSDTRFIDAHRLYLKLGYTKTGRTRPLNDLSNSIEYEFVKEL